jgi:hypothetical protein
MEPDDPDGFSSNMNPIDAVARLDGKRRIGKKEKQEREPLDIAAMRMNAWNKQRQAQKERIRNSGGVAALLESMTAAADMELAALGVPFSLKLEIDAGGFNWVLLSQTDPNAGEVAAKSDRFALSDVARETIGGRLKEFLINNAV